MKRKAVCVVWSDAGDHSPGEWTPLPKKARIMITTVGILVRKDRDNLVLAQSFDDNTDPLYRGVFSIPRSAVISITTLTD